MNRKSLQSGRSMGALNPSPKGPPRHRRPEAGNGEVGSPAYCIRRIHVCRNSYEVDGTSMARGGQEYSRGMICPQNVKRGVGRLFLASASRGETSLGEAFGWEWVEKGKMRASLRWNGASILGGRANNEPANMCRQGWAGQDKASTGCRMCGLGGEAMRCCLYRPGDEEEHQIRAPLTRLNTGGYARIPSNSQRRLVFVEARKESDNLRY